MALVSGVNIPDHKRIEIALRSVFGIGATRSKQVIAEETQRFMQAFNHKATGPVIQRLREQAQDLKNEELERLINKLRLAELDPSARKEIEKSFDRLINKLLHPPLASLRDDAAEGHRRGLLEALRHLFNLGEE